MKDEFFGNGDQRAILKRGHAMAKLVENDVKYSYYGRTVGLETPEAGGIDQLVALINLQGHAHYMTVALDKVSDIKAKLLERGLNPMHYDKWEGVKTALAAVQKVVEAFSIPNDLTMVPIDETTPRQLLISLAELSLDCGVLPPCGQLLRGALKPAVCLVAVDQKGRVMSCAAASAFADPKHTMLGKQAWWGMLATHPSRRGQRLALLLGAHAMLIMRSRYGYQDFMTGVEAGNTASEAVCGRLGLAPEGFAILSCADPNALPSGRMTK